MKRNIIKIDEDKCIGCGACAQGCSQGAIGMVDGKARLMREDYCDGLGKCLPMCPVGAISFETKEVQQNKEADIKKNLPCGCPGEHSKSLKKENDKHEDSSARVQSALSQWPVQIKLVPFNAPYFDGAHLLIAADCAAYAYGNFHKDFIKNKITLIGCPKLDDTDYSEKLSEIIKNNDIKSVTVARMEVPCCSGIERMAKQALEQSGKSIPLDIKIISVDGEIK